MGSFDPRLHCMRNGHGKGDWLDKMVVYDEPMFKDGYITVSKKPGLGFDLHPDVVRAHLATGEQWWG